MLANLRALLGVVFDIVRLRRGPESLPTSTALLVFVVAAFAAGNALVASQVSVTPQQRYWPLELLVGIVVTLVWYQVALGVAGKRERFVQTLTALFAVRALFTPVLIPMAAAVRAQVDATQHAPAALAILALLLIIWLLVVEVRIIRTAFEWTTGGAIALVLAQEFAVVLTFALVVAFLPKPA
jgi:hypothetical protein